MSITEGPDQICECGEAFHFPENLAAHRAACQFPRVEAENAKLRAEAEHFRAAWERDETEKEKIRAAFVYMGPRTQAGLTLEALAKGAGILLKTAQEETALLRAEMEYLRGALEKQKKHNGALEIAVQEAHRDTDTIKAASEMSIADLRGQLDKTLLQLSEATALLRESRGYAGVEWMVKTDNFLNKLEKPSGEAPRLLRTQTSATNSGERPGCQMTAEEILRNLADKRKGDA